MYSPPPWNLPSRKQPIKTATMDSSDFRFAIADLRFGRWTIDDLKRASCPSSMVYRPSSAFNRKSKIANSLAFRELEALVRALLPVLLALFVAGVAGNQPGLLERAPQVGVEFDERACNPVTNCPGLSGRPTAVHIDQHVELGRHVGQ